jgi:hypothetical protein
LTASSLSGCVLAAMDASQQLYKTYESVLLQRSHQFIGEADGVVSARKLVSIRRHLLNAPLAIGGDNADIRGEDMLLDLGRGFRVLCAHGCVDVTELRVSLAMMLLEEVGAMSRTWPRRALVTDPCKPRAGAFTGRGGTRKISRRLRGGMCLHSSTNIQAVPRGHDMPTHVLTT